MNKEKINTSKSIYKILFICTLICSLVINLFVVVNLEKILAWDEVEKFEDYSLSVRDWGNGEPTVIVEGGLDQAKHKYFLISFFTSIITRTITYDHSGIGRSTKNSNPRTLPYYVEELRNLIKKKGLHPPFILVGHSSGGHIIRYFTFLYPDEVAGLVFIDVPHEDWFEYIRQNWSDEEIRNYFKWWYPEHPDMNDTKTLEKLEYEENCDLLRGKTIPENIPVLMFTGNNVRHFRKDKEDRKKDMKAWAEMQHSLIKDLDDAKQIVDLETGHYPFKDKPVMVMREINKFIYRIKDGKMWLHQNDSSKVGS